MILTCPECKSRYVVSPKALMPRGRTVRCAKCSHSWFEAKPADDTEIVETEAVVKETEEKKPEPSPAKESENKNNLQAKTADDKEEPSEPESDFDFPINKPPKRRRPIPQGSNLPALQNQKYGSSKFGWISLLVFITAVISLFLIFQDTITDKWPASKKLYNVIGLDEQNTKRVYKPSVAPINERLVIRDLAPTQEARNNVPYLVVSGNVENISATVQSIPQIKVILMDEQRNAIREWTFAPATTSINSGEITSFETSLPNPPAEAKDLSVLFATN